MKLIHHKNLTLEKWSALPLAERLANVGSEVERTIIWKNKGNAEYARLAFERCLELLDLTIESEPSFGRKKELLRARELLADWQLENAWHTTDDQWQRYFISYAIYARNQFHARTH